MIDLEMMPPDWKFAENHAKANKPGLVDDFLSFTSQNVICPCCLKPIIKREVSLLSNSKQLEFMGFGFPLYFIYIKYCIILLLILICSYSTISVYFGIRETAQYCSKQSRLLAASGSSSTVCETLYYEMSRIDSVIDEEEIILRITSFIIHLLALLYIRDNINKTMEYYNERMTSLSDFSLIIRNLPLREGIQNSLRTFIQNHFKDKWEELKVTYDKQEFQSDNKVAQITLLPDINNYYKLLSQKNQVIEEKRILMKNYEEFDKDLSLYPSPSNPDLQKISLLKSKIRNTNEKITLIDQNIIEISVHMRNMGKQDVLQSSIAIVTFTTEVFMAEVLEAGQSQKLNSLTLGQYFGDFEGEIKIQKAPEPSEIIWRNANYSIKKIIFSKIISWLLSLVFIIVVTVAFYFLLKAKTNYLLSALEEQGQSRDPSTNEHYKIALFLEYLLIFLIIFFNKFVMGDVLHHFTHHEIHFSTADEEFSFALKYTLGMFFTTALMTLAVEAITFHNVYEHQFGVVEEQFIIFIVNALLIPIIWLINPWQIKTLILRKLRMGSKKLTQREANDIMCDTPYTMGKRYSQIIKTMWFTFLYASLIPIGSFFSVLGLALYYWVDKYNLLRKSSLAHNISGDMAVLSLKLLDFTLVLKPGGELIFDYLIRHKIQIQSIVLTFVGGLYLVLPTDEILQFFHRQDFHPVKQTFNEVKDMFLETYQTMHPILSFKALKIFERIRQKSSKEISLNQIQVTLAELSPNRKSPYKHFFMDSKNKLPQYLSDSLMKSGKSGKSAKSIKSVQDEQAEKEFLNYEYRSKINKTASKNYFAMRLSTKKENQMLPPYLR